MVPLHVHAEVAVGLHSRWQVVFAALRANEGSSDTCEDVWLKSLWPWEKMNKALRREKAYALSITRTKGVVVLEIGADDELHA